MYDEKITGHSAENELDISDKLVVRISDVVVGEDSVDFTVDALKLVEGDLSGEIVVQIRELGGGVLKETREYVTLKDAESTKSISMPISLRDGMYVISYSITTAGGDVVSGSKRIQVGAIVEPAPEPGATEKPKAEGGGNDLLIIGLAVLLGVVIGFALLRRKPGARRPEKSEASGAKKKKQA